MAKGIFLRLALAGGHRAHEVVDAAVLEDADDLAGGLSAGEAATARATGAGPGRKLWELGWGLLFVLAMTALSEWGPRTLYSKVPPPPAISQQAFHAVK
ncbi:MAG TPA: hypothetical protein VGN01_20080 [Acidobacteriaceae bacterium]|jgi:hypothetical protein